MSRTVLHHIAFLVRSLERAAVELGGLGLSADEVGEFPSEGTREQYFGDRDGAGRILLMEASGVGPYATALDRRGPGLHHVALHVEDLDAFLTDVVEGSGWLIHPRSFATRRAASTVWLTRPNVEALIELHECEIAALGASRVERVLIAGLDAKPELGRIFDGCGLDVTPGPGSGIAVAGATLVSPGEDVVKIDDAFAHNRAAWDRNVRHGNRWTVPVSSEDVERARRGSVEVLLTPSKPVPADWLGELGGRNILCLASGGGQQGPLFAAAGAHVTVFDASDEQLARDREVAERDNLSVRIEQGDMRDLGRFDDASFDLIFHPCSNSFVEEIEPVWREAFRALRPGGELLAGFSNPILNCFDWGSIERGTPRLRFRLPYRDIDHLDVPWVARTAARGEPLEFGHPLTQQIGGQLAAGFELIGFYEDGWGNTEHFPDAYFDAFIATRARKPGAA